MRGFPERMILGHGVTGWVCANKQLMVNADAELDLGEIARISITTTATVHERPRNSCRGCHRRPHCLSPYAFSETDRMLIESLAERLPSALSGSRQVALALNPHLISIGSKA